MNLLIYLAYTKVFCSLLNMTFKSTGVITVVITTTTTIGAKNAGFIRPTAIPLFATISATSPLDTIPVPICIDSSKEYLHNLAPKAQPIILLNIATINNTPVNIKIVEFISVISTFIPILAKNIGDNNI